MRKVTCFVVISILLCSTAVLHAQAASVFLTQEQTFGDSIPTFEETLTFDKFDASLGTLLSIEVGMYLESTGGSLTVDNDGAQPATVTAKLGVQGAMSSTDVSFMDTSFQFIANDIHAYETATYALAADDGDGPSNVDPSAPDAATLIGNSSQTSDNGYLHSLVHGQYIGSGTFDVTVDVAPYLNFGGVGGLEGGFTNMIAGGNVQVIYEYEPSIPPVPVPGSVVLLVSGLGFMAWMRRRN
ncbi:MAG: hypothetical protein CSA33_05325 [Desulfobulbus propionicus]|nr:MAG: hypothetical protein CSA33_05325 [Desulfobulbus propionicus]